MKRFNVTGVCLPDKHYMVDLTEKADGIVRDYIEPGAYFTIDRAHQFGKTTMLAALSRRLSDGYLVIRISFEAADDYFTDMSVFANGLVMDIAGALERAGVDGGLLTRWEKRIEGPYPLKSLGRKISDLCKNSARQIVLMIDEVDKCSDNQIFLSFLGLLRSKYLDMQEGMDISFHSVILAGVYNVKNLKLKLRPDEERKYNSPWNIAADFDVDMRFSTDEIAKMLAGYCSDAGVSMDVRAVSGKIGVYTDGYPFLVSWICKWIDERGGRQWSVQSVDAAEKELLASDNTLFDDMVKNIENNKELKRAVELVLIDGEKIPFARTNPAISLGVMFGILKEKDKHVAISNIVFETLLYNHIIAEKLMERHHFGCENKQFVDNGELDMERVLQKFQDVMKAEHRAGDETFIERQGRLLFLCFVKPIINGRGNYYVEPETRDNTRMDIVISFGSREYIVELKIWRGEQYRRRGLEQLGKYLDSRNSRKGYLVSFNFNKGKEYARNTISLDGGQKEVYEIVV